MKGRRSDNRTTPTALGGRQGSARAPGDCRRRGGAYPLTIDFAFVQNADGSFSQTTATDQRDEISESLSTDGFVISRNQLHNEVHATDTLNYDSGLNFQGSAGSNTGQTYVTTGC